MTMSEQITRSTALEAWWQVSKALLIPSLAVIVSLLLYIYTTLDNRVKQLEAAEPTTQSRLAVIETNMARGRADRERFQQDVADALRDIRTTQLETAKAIASLTATLDEMRRNK